MEVLVLFFTLVIGHAVADFVLQPSPMSRGKNRRNSVKLQEEFGKGFPPWYYWLGSHALTHAGAVMIVTGSAMCAVIELISHFLIDLGKCERYYNFHMDQLLHVACKLLYAVLIQQSLV
jgi:hypothetical protein